MSFAELKRIIGNIVQVGTIGETKSKEGKALARVVLDNDGENKRVSAFLPVVSFANSFARVWFPIRVGEQVLVISLFGNANRGFIIRSIFNKGCKEPLGANEHTTIFEFEDKTRLSYDSKLSNLVIDAVKSINIKCVTVNIEASESAYLKAPITTIESNVTIKGTLTVEQLFTASGGMKVFAKAGETVGAVLECELVSNKKITANSFVDSKGDLTNHTNQGYGRD